eukprot:5345298-Amphidinium_carterae.1
MPLELAAGVPWEEVGGNTLLQQIRATSFEGISGQVSFNQQGAACSTLHDGNEHQKDLAWASIGSSPALTKEITTSRVKVKSSIGKTLSDRKDSNHYQVLTIRNNDELLQAMVYL